MTTFTPEVLECIASWTSVVAGFDRDGPRTEGSIIHTALDAFARELENGGVSSQVFEDGGLSNYCAMFCTSSELPLRDARPLRRMCIPGSTIYFSLLGPYAVVGHSSLIAERDVRGLPTIGVRDVIDPQKMTTSLDQAIVRAFDVTPYALLNPFEVGSLLPPGIVPYEYCLDEEPWDRVFHVLFANTD